MGLEKGTLPRRHGSTPTNANSLGTSNTVEKGSWPVLFPCGDYNDVALDPAKKGPLSSTTPNVPLEESRFVRLAQRRHLQRDRNFLSWPPPALASLSVVHCENAPPLPLHQDRRGERWQSHGRKAFTRRVSSRCLLDESIKDVNTPALTPDVPRKPSNQEEARQGTLDGEDSQQCDFAQCLSDGDTECGGVIQGSLRHSEVDSSTCKGIGARLRPNQANLHPTRLALSPTRSPDRFLSPCDASNRRRELLLLNKPASRLSRVEKIFRRRINRSNPFRLDPRNANRETHEPGNRLRRRVIRPTRVYEGIALDARSDPLLRRARPVANSSFRSGPRIRDARNILTPVNSSDNRVHVPVYSSHFLDNATPKFDHNLHIQRLALACDIDLSSRIHDPSPSAYDSQSARLNHPFRLSAVQPGSPT